MGATNVGAAARAEGHGGAAGLEANSPAVSKGETSSPAPSTGERKQCKMFACTDTKRELKRELREMKKMRDLLQRTLDTERKTHYHTYCEGEFRREHNVPTDNVQRTLDSSINDMVSVQKNNARYLKAAKEVRPERKVFLLELAQVRGELTIATRTIAQTARREVVELRARGRQDRVLYASVARGTDVD